MTSQVHSPVPTGVSASALPPVPCRLVLHTGSAIRQRGDAYFSGIKRTLQIRATRTEFQWRPPLRTTPAKTSPAGSGLAVPTGVCDLSSLSGHHDPNAGEPNESRHTSSIAGKSSRGFSKSCERVNPATHDAHIECSPFGVLIGVACCCSDVWLLHKIDGAGDPLSEGRDVYEAGNLSTNCAYERHEHPAISV
jgi:hypothetical protein